MKFFCAHCQAKYSIPDEKALGKILKIRCKQCQATIVLRNGVVVPQAAAPGPPPAASPTAPRPAMATMDALPVVQVSRPHTARGKGAVPGSGGAPALGSAGPKERPTTPTLPAMSAAPPSRAAGGVSPSLRPVPSPAQVPASTSAVAPPAASSAALAGRTETPASRPSALRSGGAPSVGTPPPPAVAAERRVPDLRELVARSARRAPGPAAASPEPAGGLPKVPSPGPAVPPERGVAEAGSRVLSPPPPPPPPAAVPPPPPPVRPDVPRWFVATPAGQRGPLTFLALTGLVRSGEVGGEAYLWREGFPDWKPAGEVEEFAPILEAAARLRVVVPPPPPVFGSAPVPSPGASPESAPSRAEGGPPAPGAAPSSPPGLPAAGPPGDDILIEGLPDPVGAGEAAGGISLPDAVFTSAASAVAGPVFPAPSRPGRQESGGSQEFSVVVRLMHRSKRLKAYLAVSAVAVAAVAVGVVVVRTRFGAWDAPASSPRAQGRTVATPRAWGGEALKAAAIGAAAPPSGQPVTPAATSPAPRDVITGAASAAPPAPRNGPGGGERSHSPSPGGTRSPGAPAVPVLSGNGSLSGLFGEEKGNLDIQRVLPRGRTDRARSGMSPTEVTEVVRQYGKNITACFERQLKRDGGFQHRKVVISFVVKPSGNATDIRVSDGLQATVFGRCVRQQVKTWRFPSFDGPDVPVEYPVILTSSE